jgi:hypothetical protein
MFTMVSKLEGILLNAIRKNPDFLDVSPEAKKKNLEKEESLLRRVREIHQEERDCVVELLERFSGLQHEFDSNKDSLLFFDNYYKSYTQGEVNPEWVKERGKDPKDRKKVPRNIRYLENDPSRREIFHDSTLEFLTHKDIGSGEVAKRYFNYWNKVSRIPITALRLWKDTFDHVSREGLKQEGSGLMMEKRLLKYLDVTSSNLAQFKREYGRILELLGAKNNLYGMESFLFSRVRNQDLCRKQIGRSFRVLEKIPFNAKQLLELSRKRIRSHHARVSKSEEFKKRRKIERDFDEELYQLVALKENDGSLLNKIGENLFNLTEEISRDTSQTMLEIMPFYKRLAKKDRYLFSRALSQSRVIVRENQDLLIPYLEGMLGISELKSSNKERTCYSDLLGRFFVDGSKDVSEERLSIPELGNEVRTELKRVSELEDGLRSRLFSILGCVKENPKGSTRLRKLSSSVVDGLQSDSEETFAFIESVIQYEHPKNFNQEGQEIDQFRIHKYAEYLMPLAPSFSTKIGLESWKTFLGVVYEKDNLFGKYGGAPSVSQFIGRFAEHAESMETSEIVYCLGELCSVVNNAGRNARSGKLDLELIVLDSVANRRKVFENIELTRLHKIFFNMYSQDREDKTLRFSKAPEFFDSFIGALEKVPVRFRKEVIDYAEKIVSHDRESEIGELNKCLVSYARSLESNVSFLGEKFGTWIQSVMQNNSTYGGMREVFDDPHEYFQSHLDDIAQGLSLTDVRDSLRVFARALTGKDIRIGRSERSDLSCEFKEQTFYLPRALQIFSGDSDCNFRAYKALTAYQAGAFLFGTYNLVSEEVDSSVLKRVGSEELNLGNLLGSYENPNIARELFNLLELSRIDARLRDSYIGIRSDLDLIKNHVDSRKVVSKREANDVDTVLDMVHHYIYSGKNIELNKKNLDKTCQKITSVIDSLSNEGTGVASTVNAVDKIYRSLENLIDLSQQSVEEREKVLEIDFETIVADRGNEGVGYLVADPSSEIVEGNRFRYDEWDANTKSYKEGFVQVVVCELPENGNGSLVKDHLIIQNLRERFEMMRPQERDLRKKQLSGDVDYDAFIQARADIVAGITPSEKLYTREFKDNRSVAALVLSEVSGSTRKFIDLDNPDVRLIDIIKQSKFYISEALEAIGDNYALAAFSGETERNVNFFMLKDFGQRYDSGVRERIASLQPLKQNRDGAGIRHAAYLLSNQPEKTKLLFYLMEGLPHDFGYEKDYAIEDTRKAIIESKSHGCIPVVLAYGENIPEGVSSLAQHCIYRESREPSAVPKLLPNLYRRIAL